ncbi:MAG: hypothetical protein C5B54_04115 [Acidobacteria bacterium]|nr:MAG: hypothetical protein C5B54_04115 [Acidobacteriota bacterium]
MRMVHQIGDEIWVRDNDQHYGESLKIFSLDYGRAAPSLPKGITQRIYEPGIRHALQSGNVVIAGGPLPWPEGDAILQKVDKLFTAKRARELRAVAAARKKAQDEVDAINAKNREEYKKALSDAKARWEAQQQARVARGEPRWPDPIWADEEGKLS